MNIFILDENIQKNAQFHCDKHVVKMIVESCQLLANAFTMDKLKTAPLTKNGKYRQHTFINHPCSKWVVESWENYLYLCQLTNALINEYNFRYNKKHFLEDFLNWVLENMKSSQFKMLKRTEFVRAIKKDKYPDLLSNKFSTIEAYREYYKRDKLFFAKWTKRNKPYWIKEGK